jgi:hypothetical protein
MQAAGDDVDGVLDAEQARAYLGMSRASFYNLVREQAIKRYKILSKGRRRYFKKADLDQLNQPIPADEEKPLAARPNGRRRRAG